MIRKIVLSIAVAALATVAFAQSGAPFKVLYNYNAMDMNADPTAALLEKLTGQKAEYTMLPKDNADEKLYVELASNVAYNAVKVNRQQFDQLVSKNALLDLTPYINKSKNLKSAISAATWAAVKDKNGKILGIPEKNASDNINNALIVRKDILDAEKLAMPTTTDEFQKVLKTLIDRGYAQPLVETRTGGNSKDNGIAGAFGIANDWISDSGKLTYFGASKNFKDYVEFMKTLRNIGALGQDWPTKDADAVARFTKPAAEKPAVFMTFAWWSAKGVYDTLKKNGVADPAAALDYIPSLKGPAGKQAAYKDLAVSYITVIPRYMNKTADAVVQWIDKRLDPKVFQETVIGTEGYHYLMKNGQFWPNMELNADGKAKFDEKNNSSWYLMGTRETDYALQWQARVRKTPENYDAWSSMQNIKYGEYNPLGFAPVIEDWTKIRTPLQTKTFEFAQKYILGDPNATWEAFQDELKKIGVEKADTAVNAWFKTQKK